jgi:hypothetical protein
VSWLKVDDRFDVDRRVQELSLDARGLLISAATYSARNLLDGRIDGKWLFREARRRSQRERIVRELVEANLVSLSEDGGFHLLPLHDDADDLLHTYKPPKLRREGASRRTRNVNSGRDKPH